MLPKRFTISLSVVLLVLSACSSSLTVKPLEVRSLRCEYLKNPLGIEVTQPRLSWRLESSQRGQKQTAYRILVASSIENLDKDQGDLWDSKKMISDHSSQLVYKGTPLESQMQCFWKVMVWDKEGASSEWSDSAKWSMGLLNSTDWKAEWIGFDKIPVIKSKPHSQPKTKPDIIIITKAIYGLVDDPAKQVDVTAKIQAQVSSGKFDIKASNKFAGKDPAPGKKKTLKVTFTVNGKAKTVKIPENKTSNLLNGRTKKKIAKTYLPAPYLRREFTTNKEIARGTLYVTAQGFAEMHLNGKRVGDEYFMPGWTDYRKRIYYRTYDVTSMLKPGKNAIGAILSDGWFRGNISIKGQNQYGKQIRLKAQLQIDYTDGNSETIASNSSWKASFGPILESDMQAGETFDARKEMNGWNRHGFNETGWTAVNAGSVLKNSLLIQSYPGDPVRKILELPTIDLNEPQSGKFVFDLGQNFSGWIRLKVQGQAGEKVVMRFGEMLKADGTVYTENLRSARAIDTYICKGDGVEVWEPRFTFHGFRYVEITGLSAPPSPEMVTGIVIHTDAPMTSSFECSNPMLNQLHSNIVWGQRSNYIEVPMDCPQRDERLGWTGDTQIFIRSGTYHQDVASFFTKWMVDLMDTQNNAGTFGNQAPVFHGHGSPGWADAGIICPWTIYQIYGDARMIEKYYENMARFIEYGSRNGKKGLGNKGFGDWLAVGSKTPKNLISAAYFGYSTSLMIKIADALGKKMDVQKYQKLFEGIKKEFQDVFVEKDGKIMGNSQTAYCLALYYNLLTDKQREQATLHLVERIKAKDYHLSVGFLGVSILLPTLTEIGRSDLAYRLIQNKTYPSWGYSIEQGATTIWERWNSYTKKDGFGDVNMNSFNHYAYGSCSEWMFRSILGINTDGAGYKKIIMKPEFDDSVKWAKGHYDSINGRISSDWEWSRSNFKWAITVPPNTTAKVYMPNNFTEFTESGNPIEKAKGVKFLGNEKGRDLYEVSSGKYIFKTKT